MAPRFEPSPRRGGPVGGRVSPRGRATKVRSPRRLDGGGGGDRPGMGAPRSLRPEGISETSRRASDHSTGGERVGQMSVLRSVLGALLSRLWRIFVAGYLVATERARHRPEWRLGDRLRRERDAGR